MKAVSVPAAAPALAPPAAALKLMSDERLARWAARGNQTAFAVIFERHHQALHRYCHSIVGNAHDAGDALQNTMLKALRALPGEKRAIALKPWLYRIAHNESISLLRSRRSDSSLEAAAQIGAPSAAATAESRERLRDLTADLQELSEQQRGALLMRELGGLQFNDVGDALAVTATAAKQSIYEARCALQSLEEGRAMDCDLIRRTLSDGDRRTLRTMKVRGHLRACAGCRDFEAALRHRPAHLAGLAPPLPLAAAATMLHGLLGGGAGHGGGGLLAGLGAGAKSGGAFSLGAAKVATVAVIAGGAAGGAIYVSPDGPAQRSDGPPVARESASAGNGSVSPVATPSGADDESARMRSARRSAGSGLTSSGEAAATADDTATAGEQAQPPAANPAPMRATPAIPRPATATAPAAGGEAAADSDAPAEGAAGRPQTAPAPAAAPYVPPARPAPAPATAPATTTAPAAGSAPVTAAPAAAPAASAIDLANTVAAPRPR